MIKWLLLVGKVGRLLQKFIHSTMKNRWKSIFWAMLKKKKKEKKGFPSLWGALPSRPQRSGQHGVPQWEPSGAGYARTKQSGKTLKTILSQFMSVTKAERRSADSRAQQVAVPLPIPLIPWGIWQQRGFGAQLEGAGEGEGASPAPSGWQSTPTPAASPPLFHQMAASLPYANCSESLYCTANTARGWKAINTQVWNFPVLTRG